MHREKFFFACQARFLDKFPSIAFLWISCKVPKSALKKFFWLLNSQEKQKQSKERGQRECQMEANAGEERGRSESALPAPNWHATSHHIPHFFFLMLAYLVIILVVSSNGTQHLLGRQSWLYQEKLERNVMPSKVS